MTFHHHHENAWQALVRQVRENTGPSFDVAWDEMRKKGNPKRFFLKTSGVLIGSALIGDGIYNFTYGMQEQVEDMLLSDNNHLNYVRMFTGFGEMAAGAAMLYAGLTKTGLNR